VTDARPRFAGADWGTTRLRVWLFGPRGEVLGERRSDEGLLAAQPDRFAGILEAQLASLGAARDLPVVICGMAGARQGWVEAPYVHVPATPAETFGSAIRVPGTTRDIRIIPGMAQADADAPDVMRGEETQLAGLEAVEGSRLVCMPGTHSKWVGMEDGTVAGFQTFMTGELFSVLSGHSILLHATGAPPASFDPTSKSFAAAIRTAFHDGHGFATNLFRVRAGSLLSGTDREHASATLSGLLIGAEIGAATARFGHPAQPVALIASGAMAELYAAALEAVDLPAATVDADAAVRNGLVAAARVLGLDAG
jgi:2-dehydro-3-deoxygalactonokinase